MGLKTLDPFYKRMVDKMSRKLLWKTVVANQDDITAATLTEEEHIKGIRGLFEVMSKKDRHGSLG